MLPKKVIFATRTTSDIGECEAESVANSSLETEHNALTHSSRTSEVPSREIPFQHSPYPGHPGVGESADERDGRSRLPAAPSRALHADAGRRRHRLRRLRTARSVSPIVDVTSSDCTGLRVLPAGPAACRQHRQQPLPHRQLERQKGFMSLTTSYSPRLIITRVWR